MATLRVPLDFATIALAEANAAPGDIIAVDPSYAGGESVLISVENLTIDIPATVLGIEVTLDAGVQDFSLLGAGPAIVNGNGLSNTVKGNAGANTFNGGAGADHFIGLAGDDVFVGGSDRDHIDYSLDPGHIDPGTLELLGVRVNQLATGPQGNPPIPADTGFDGFGGTDSIAEVRDVTGSMFNDELWGGNHANIIRALDGDDFVSGGRDNDRLEAGAGNDTVGYSGARDEYSVELLADGSIRVTDLRAGSPEGSDRVFDAEQFQFSDGTIATFDLLQSSDSRVPLHAIKANAGDDVVSGDDTGVDQEVFFFDTDLGQSTGNDRLDDFGLNDLFVTTSLIYDSNGDGIVGFGGNRRLDLPGATGNSPVSPNDSSGFGQVGIFNLDGSQITQLHLDGTVQNGGITYYVYSQLGSGVSPSDLSFG